MENMSEWIFKIIWVPIAFMLTMCSIVLLTYMLSQVNWDAPMRWLAMIGIFAYIADWYVNK
jgi:hypothetical protein